VRKVLAVIRREFVERVRTKWFWVGTILGPILFGGLIVFQFLLTTTTGGERRMVVVDGTTSPFGARLSAGLAAAIPRFRITWITAGPGVIDSLRDEVVAKRLDGFLLVDDRTLEAGTAEYRGSNASAPGDIELLERVLGRLIFVARLDRLGIDPSVVRHAEGGVHLATQRITRRGDAVEGGEQGVLVAFATAVILLMPILIYGIQVMGSVLEEKTSRIVEVLVSSLRPFQLMLGKVIGAGAVGLLQLSVWVASAAFVTSQQGRLGRLVGVGVAPPGAGIRLPHVPAATLVVLFAYFLLGYFLYAAVFAAVGAISSNEQDGRQAQMPISFVLMIPYVSLFGILNEPNGQVAVFMSLLPIWSPIAMPVRWSATAIPIGELTLSLLILLASVVGVTWVAAKIYRVGILMTGKRPSIREVLRWVHG
jgi:ABC-2 type transport system permease protein